MLDVWGSTLKLCTFELRRVYMAKHCITPPPFEVHPAAEVLYSSTSQLSIQACPKLLFHNTAKYLR
jgi:hypothetical protein